MSLQLLDELSLREKSLNVCFHVGCILKPSPHSSEGMGWTEVRSAEKARVHTSVSRAGKGERAQHSSIADAWI